MRSLFEKGVRRTLAAILMITLSTPGIARPAHTEEYRAQLLDVYPRYGTAIALRGGYAVALVRARNVGTASWPVDGLVKVRTAVPLDRHSPAYSFDWESDTRASGVDLNESDPQANHVDPGQVGVFIFTLRVPSDGVFCEDFEFVADRDSGPDRMGNRFFVEPYECSFS